MIVIRTAEEMARALSSPLEPELKHRLQTHFDQLAEWTDFGLGELVVFVIVEEGDTLEHAEAAYGQTLVQDCAFANLPELVENHGGWIEATIILSDDGFGLVLMVQVGPMADSRLIAASRNAREYLHNSNSL